MADVKIDISAKDGASATMGKVGDAGESLGERMKKAAAGLYLIKEGFNMIVGAAKKVIDFGADMVKAWGVQEKAERDLIAAHNAMGEAGEKYIEDEKRIAAAIQDETGVGDEVTLQRMARARALGVETNKLEECAKGIVALTNAGMSEDAATRALAQAYAGNFNALQQYIPALRDATDEADKQAIVADFLTQGYDRQKETIDTVQGAWGALQGRIGDAKEVVGKAIIENLNLTDSLKKAGDKVNEISGRMAEWCQTGGLARAIMFVKMFGENCKYSIAAGLAQILKWYEGAKFYLVGPWKLAYEVSGAFWNSIKEGAKYAGEWCKYLWDSITGKNAKKPDTSMVRAAWNEVVDTAINSFDRQNEAYEKSCREIDAATEELRKKRDAAIEDIGNQYFKKMDEIREKAAQTGEKIADAADTTVKKTSETAEKVVKVSADAAKRAAAEAQRELERLQKAADAANAAFQGMNDKRARDNEKDRRRKERDDRKQQKDHERYEKRMQEYLRRWESGGNLSKKQNEQLDEYLKLQKAAIDAQKALAAAKANAPQPPGAALGAPGGAGGQGGAGGNAPGVNGPNAQQMIAADLAKILGHVASMDGTLDKCLRIG